MIDGRVQGWLIFLFYVLILVEADGLYAEIKYIESAVAKGAVCLDGSPPAYHFDKGFGSGINNWLVHIEGGGWCHNITKCLARKNTRLGSSKQMEKQLAFSGILINKGQYNPDFYNWNRVKIGYCDGASFTGDVEEVDPANNLYFRGARIWVAVMEELLANGMSNAENALLSGCSAGGLTTILHCDSFRALLPMGTKVKCLSDGGYFINANDISGIPHMRAYFNEVATLHGSAKNLPQSCTLSMKPSMCFFPQYIVEKIRTPLFILNSAYDSWQVMHFQIRNILAPGDADPRDHWHYFMLDIKPTVLFIRNILAPSDADPHDHWHYCKLDMKQCSPSQLATIQVFRLEFLSALARLGSSLSRGMFINSCFAHCQSELQGDWLWPDSPLLNKTTIAKAVGDWFYDRNPFQMIDCPYPCDMSCQRHQVFHPQEL